MSSQPFSVLKEKLKKSEKFFDKYFLVSKTFTIFVLRENKSTISVSNIAGTASSIMDNAAFRVEDRLRCRFESCLAVKVKKLKKI